MPDTMTLEYQSDGALSRLNLKVHDFELQGYDPTELVPLSHQSSINVAYIWSDHDIWTRLKPIAALIVLFRLQANGRHVPSENTRDLL